MNRLNRFTLITVLILIFSSKMYAQSLSLNDLQTICNKSNWEYVNQYLMNKGWEYYESEKGSSTKYNTITWSLNKSYGDKAEGWFYLYTYEGLPNKIAYSVFNKPAYSKIQNSISSLGYKLTDSEIEDNEITSTYSNSKFILEITTEKREKKNDYSYYDESITAYRFLLIKKSGVYDPDNGKKTDYWYGEDNIQVEYTLKNGKLNGKLISYYYNGNIKKEGNYINGKENGLFKEYNEDGSINNEYNMKNGEMNGAFKTYYENGELKKQGFYKNGKAYGKFIEFDDNGNKTTEYNMLEDQFNGLATIFEKNKKSIETVYEKGFLKGEYTEYHYDDDGKLNLKVIGTYENDKKNGEWYTLVIDDNETDTVEIRNYKNDLKHGRFEEFVNSDTIEISNYHNNVREGSYVMKTKATGYMTDDYLPISWWNIDCEGFYKNGKRDGNWQFYSMGILSEEGKYINDKKNGKWIKYVSMGNHIGEILSETNYSNNLENGTYKKFFKLDLVTDSTSENISYKFFNNIPIYESYSYINGIKTGDYLLKDSLNNTKVKGQYLDDLESGIWKIYNDNNNIYCKINYYKGVVKDKSYFENNEKYLTEKYENGDIKELENFKNSKLLEEHIIISKRDKYVVNVINYEAADTIYSYMYNVNSEEKYNYKVFKGFGSKEGEFFMKVNDVKIVTGKYHSNLKSGYWIFNYPSQNAYATKKFKSGKMVAELFYDNSDKQLFRGKLIVKQPNNHKEIIKIKKGLRNGKTRFVNEKNEVYKVIKYKKGVRVD